MKLWAVNLTGNLTPVRFKPARFKPDRLKFINRLHPHHHSSKHTKMMISSYTVKPAILSCSKNQKTTAGRSLKHLNTLINHYFFGKNTIHISKFKKVDTIW